MAPDDLPPLSPDAERLLSAERSAPGPSPELMSRISARLDASIALDGAAPSATTAKTTQTATSMKAASSVLGGVAAFKWVGAALVVAGLGAAGWVVSSSTDDTTSPTPLRRDRALVARPSPAAAPASAPAIPPTATTGATTEKVLSPAPPGASLTPVPLATGQLPELGSSRAFERLPLETAAATASEAPPRVVKRPTAAPDLEGERQLLSQARTALRAGHTSTTLTLLAQHRASHPFGALVEEREALRILALAAKGDRTGASKAAERFRARFKKSVHDGAIRAALGQ